MPTRRVFLGSMSLPAALAMGMGTPLFAAPSRSLLLELATPHGSAEEAARDEDYWSTVSRCYTQDRSIINLNNGGVSPAPSSVQEAMKRHLDHANSMPPPMVLFHDEPPRKAAIRARLAAGWGVGADEIAITRNASESLQACQFGMDLSRGDEVLCCTQDYPRMVNTFKQRCRREGLTLTQIRLPPPSSEADADAIVRLYEQAITPRTRMILVSHMIFHTGQVLPVREIVAMARGKNGGIPVIVDGAHAFAHVDFTIGELGCDYYGTSLHKWLCAPHGTGMLYVRKDRIDGLWPLMAADEKQASDIRKFEEIGTHPTANLLAIAEALDFHQAIGAARKQARLRYLRDRWASRFLPGSEAHAGSRAVRFHTPMKPGPRGELRSCAIATFEIEGIEPERIVEHLWERHRILVTQVKADDFAGVRVSPNVYTTPEAIDRFADAVERLRRDGLPG
ncbi:MAG: aminotransferase class V-fold PLP-dependent enzyme [Phycisphaerales bacterium]|nr:aminotransferase class V-fold PLP-dependent enzyme [Phycisphaerales bacterium]